MEKLIVKNFGPIKHAEIDLTKYVVFIGDTSTGKSVLAKLIAIFRDSCNTLQILKEDDSVDIIKQLKHYNIDFDIINCEIKYFDGINNLELNNNNIYWINKNLKHNSLTHLDKLTTDKIIDELADKIVDELADISDFDKAKILDIVSNQFLKIVNSTYIPAERILFSLISNSLSGLWANNVALPDCYKDFAGKFEVARKEINFSEFKSFEINYNYNDGLDKIILNNSEIFLSQASSGIQSLIPLLISLDYDINKYKADYSKSFIIEEPELNLFPKKQKLLIDHIIERVNRRKNKIVITTHSPYILSALDTLILAKNTFNEHPDLKEEISVIVSQDKWIDYDEISIYEVRNDGKVYSIKNEEYRSIDSNAIDSVSDIISEEFDKLTELRYAH